MYRPATIKAVAAEAGVAIGTVSRVLNASGPASPETREKVLRAAAVLQYQASDFGRALQSNRSRTVGCLVPSVVNPVFADAIQAAQTVAENAGFHFVLVCSGYDTEREEEAIRMLLQKNVEGVVVTVSDVERSPGLALLKAREVPHCLLFNNPSHRSPATWVDNAAASAEVALTFARLGHRHTAFLALRFSASDRSRHRFEGFHAACLRLGLPEPRLLEINETTPVSVGGIEALLRDNPDLTAIHASNDLLALSVMKAARRLGLLIPGDLSIVGFDGIAVGELVAPPLATVVTDARAMGDLAMRTVADAIANPGGRSTESKALPFSIRTGGTVGPVRGDGDDAASSSPSRCHPDSTAISNQE